MRVCFYIFSFGPEMIFRNIGVDMNFEYRLCGSLVNIMGKHFCLSFSRILYLHAAVIFEYCLLANLDLQT